MYMLVPDRVGALVEKVKVNKGGSVIEIPVKFQCSAEKVENFVNEYYVTLEESWNASKHSNFPQV